MRGLAVLAGWSLLAGASMAQDPPLGVPAGVPPIVEAPTVAPPPPSTSTSPPGSVFLRPARPVALPTLKPVAEDLPPLVAPAGSTELPEPLPMSTGILSLESSPLGIDPLPDARASKPIKPEPDEPGPVAGPRRRGLFGRFLPPLPAPPRPKASRSKREDVEPDAAADASLKRKVEAQATGAAGRLARSIDVRVKDRKVTIRAWASRPWNRRALRKNLEGLPALAGVKWDVDIVD